MSKSISAAAIHGSAMLRGLSKAEFSSDLAESERTSDRFFPIFPRSNYSVDERDIHALSERMNADSSPGDTVLDELPSGFVFLGQFIDHDITFDPTSLFDRLTDPNGVRNFRTPNLDLDCVYGSGPGASPHLYDRNFNEGGLHRLLLDKGREFDLPRNSQNRALIGDPRNDENFMVSQLQHGFIKFHNAIIDWLIERGERIPDGVGKGAHLFARAQELARGHYQWIVLHEFLPLMVGARMARATFHKRVLYRPRDKSTAPFIPTEFSVAAYRFGHSLVRNSYTLNDLHRSTLLFDLPHFGDPEPRADMQIEWHRFFDYSTYGHLPPQPAQRVDPYLVPELLNLRFEEAPKSLPARNMLRAQAPDFRLPSGQEAVAHANQVLVGAGEPAIRSIPNSEIEAKTGIRLSDLSSLSDQVPLWFYVLAEAAIESDGKHLGSLGGRLVGEVLSELVLGNPGNPIAKDPLWKPSLPRRDPSTFLMTDLLRLAGV